MSTTRSVQVVLASASSGRLATLRAAGVEPLVRVSSVDEPALSQGVDDPRTVVELLARAKAQDVVADAPVAADTRLVVIGCDSVLELDGQAWGKPADAAEAGARWRRQRGRVGNLLTGHHLIALGDAWDPAGPPPARSATSCAQVEFADLSDEEIDAYVATGEPLRVAGAFTLDGLGGAYVRAVTGDPHGVVGLSLPLLRDELGQWGLQWHELWPGPSRTCPTAPQSRH